MESNSGKKEKNDSKSKNGKKNITGFLKEKGKKFWGKLKLYEKFFAVSILAFILLGISAFTLGRILSGILALVAVVLLITSLLMKKQIIKGSKPSAYILMVVIAFITLIPYFTTFSEDTESDARRIHWSNIVLSDILPEPSSNLAKIHENSKKSLAIDIYKISNEQFERYINDCKAEGFSIEPEEFSDSYTAYSKTDYMLKIEYDESEGIMEITANEQEKLGALKWEECEMANLLPKPETEMGKIIKNDDAELKVYLGETSLDDYEKYIEKCSNKGFELDTNPDDKIFYAVNNDGYSLLVKYTGNNRMQIVLSEPEYDINIEVKCNENLMFSQYDVDVYVDDLYEGTIEHGKTDTYSLTLPKGTYTIRFEDAEDESVTGKIKFEVINNKTFKFEISCTNSKIDVKAIEKKKRTEDSKKEKEENISSKDVGENLTVENCPELASILSNKADLDPSYEAFAEKYQGRNIEFDGRIDYCTNYENYSTRFDYLISSGDYDPDSQIGPTFKFENVNHAQLNTNLETVSVGLNVHIVAEVVSYDNDSGLFFLNPVSVTGR